MTRTRLVRDVWLARARARVLFGWRSRVGRPGDLELSWAWGGYGVALVGGRAETLLALALLGERDRQSSSRSTQEDRQMPSASRRSPRKQVLIPLLS